MGQRICLFFAGYSAYAPSLYFNKLSFVNQYEGCQDPVLRHFSLCFSEELTESAYEQESNLRTANSLAAHFEIPVPGEPRNPVSYFEWLNSYVEGFEREFPMSRMDHYYFLYSRKLAEIFSNLGQAESFLRSEHQIRDHAFLMKKVNNCLKDSEYILFKLIASAALLSSEPRQNYFNTLYKQLNSGYDPFRGRNLSDMDIAGQQQLCADISSYRSSIKEGIKKCVSMLKELGV